MINFTASLLVRIVIVCTLVIQYDLFHCRLINNLTKEGAIKVIEKQVQCSSETTTVHGLVYWLMHHVLI